MSALFFFLGLAIGSFLNLCIDRLPKRESIVRPPSHCDACRHRLSPLDLIPLLSYLYLRGKCRYCGASIPYRVPLVEGVTGLIFLLLWNHYGLSIELPLAMLFASLFIVIVVIDIEHHLIPSRVVYPAIGLAFLVPILTHNYGIVSAVIGGATGFGILMPLAFFFPSAMGMGDVKLAALIGLLVGFPQVFIALLIGFVIGGAVGGGLLAAKLKRRKDPIPLAPFLTAGLITTVFYGEEMLKLYLGG
ncbi:Type 4 prepilin-like proteins leader peptide-processing enzyme [subsurface metagenome]